MTAGDRAAIQGRPGLFPPGFWTRLKKRARWLYPYRPRLRDRRFWAVQGLVFLIAGLHTTMELYEVLGHSATVGSEPVQISLLSFVPVSLFFIPVVYAAFNFGLSGAVATAVWCTFLTIPTLFMHQGIERVRELSQLGIVDAIAIFVGQRIEQELRARQRAEAAGAALRASEMKYRGLFESSPVPFLALGPEGAVLEANPAAGRLFGKDPRAMKGVTVADLLGDGAAARLLGRSAERERQDARFVFRPKEGPDVLLAPTVVHTSDDQGGRLTQVVLRDVTQEQRREAGLRSYAVHVLRAQEDERKRIAQELHDDAVQRLVLLCRQLDIVEDSGTPLPSSAISGVREARRSAEDIVASLRDYARALRPPALDDLGLVPAIQRVLLDLAERTKALVQLRLAGKERRLPPDAELALFRIAQEALRNVERHARADQVAVSITFAGHEARMEVVDSGAGFTPPASGDLAGSGHLGLLGMQERAESLGGKVEIQSSPGNGTRVAASIPG